MRCSCCICLCLIYTHCMYQMHRTCFPSHLYFGVVCFGLCKSLSTTQITQWYELCFLNLVWNLKHPTSSSYFILTIFEALWETDITELLLLLLLLLNWLQGRGEEPCCCCEWYSFSTKCLRGFWAPECGPCDNFLWQQVPRTSCNILPPITSRMGERKVLAMGLW